jgi:hypothetical protein
MRLSLLIVLELLLFSVSTYAHYVTEQMAQIAGAFLSSLNEDQKSKARFAMEDEERLNWHFIPRERKGLRMDEMEPQQRLLATALMSSGLSHEGLLKASTIMSLEEVMFQIESEGLDDDKKAAVRQKRNPSKYHVSIFGDPSAKGTWGWRVEGHHLSMNFTIKDGTLAVATPSFFGSNPGEVRKGALSGLRVLHVEEELGRELVKSLTAEQMKKALVNAVAPKEMLTAAERWVRPLLPNGLSATEMTAEQRSMLERLIQEYLRRMRPEIADQAWAEIQASGPVEFAWAGEKERGMPHYYRVQGKTFLLEYDNVQNEANHVHCVWRSFDRDFGADLLSDHYQREHPAPVQAKAP